MKPNDVTRLLKGAHNCSQLWAIIHMKGFMVPIDIKHCENLTYFIPRCYIPGDFSAINKCPCLTYAKGSEKSVFPYSTVRLEWKRKKL